MFKNTINFTDTDNNIFLTTRDTAIPRVREFVNVNRQWYQVTKIFYGFQEDLPDICFVEVHCKKCKAEFVYRDYM